MEAGMYVDGCHQLTVVVEQLVMCNMAVHQKHLEHGYMKFAEYIFINALQRAVNTPCCDV